jgi:hypothetical protein
MFDGLDRSRVAAMTNQERRWFNNIKKAIFEADKAYVEGRSEDRCFEEMCKAVDVAKTLRLSLLGETPSSRNNKQQFTDFLDFELPGPAQGGMDLVLIDTRKQQRALLLLVHDLRDSMHGPREREPKCGEKA